ncbi:hypothetical protein HPB47_020085 [Ixodes persulcatus]|uniref:Uncharacterized protein n=1 Tax=Ixodes persulcatus TaxID=34615 RepID=A0AC60QIA7_IXOPE|nr:hypothetical protein HPB47_020085 [Ixodes persulcatus]
MGIRSTPTTTLSNSSEAGQNEQEKRQRSSSGRQRRCFHPPHLSGIPRQGLPDTKAGRLLAAPAESGRAREGTDLGNSQEEETRTSVAHERPKRPSGDHDGRWNRSAQMGWESAHE